MQTKTILITGSSGFIGKYLVTALKESNYHVICLPRELLYDLPSLMDFLKKKQIDYIYALHAYGNMAHQKEEEKIIMANYFATWNLLRATSFLDYKGFVYISTSSTKLPHQTLYSASKIGVEWLCKAYMNEYQKPIAVVRPYSLYGIGEAEYRFIPTVFRSCLFQEPMTLSPEPVHDWLYIIDFIKALILLPKENNVFMKHSLYSVGTGIGTTNKQVVKLIEQITGKTANITEQKSLRAYDTTNWVCAERSKTATPLQTGLQIIWDYYSNKYHHADTAN